MYNISKSDIPSIVEKALDSMEQLLKEIADSNISDIYWSVTHSVWIVDFIKGASMSFVDFESIYTWLTSNK